jgi:hypothetical protein
MKFIVEQLDHQVNENGDLFRITLRSADQIAGVTRGGWLPVTKEQYAALRVGQEIVVMVLTDPVEAPFEATLSPAQVVAVSEAAEAS